MRTIVVIALLASASAAGAHDGHTHEPPALKPPPLPGVIEDKAPTDFLGLVVRREFLIGVDQEQRPTIRFRLELGKEKDPRK